MLKSFRINIVILCVLIIHIRFLSANELFFIDSAALSFKSNLVADTYVKYETDSVKREVVTMGSASIGFLLKGRSRLDFTYYTKFNGRAYNGFNYPKLSHYYGLGLNHFFKNKTSFNLNFNIEFNYFKEKSGLYDNYLFGFGISKENDSKDIPSYSHLIFYFQKPSIGESSMIVRFDFPMYVQILPQDNIPSKKSLLFTPSLILDGKDVYFSLSLGIQHTF